MKTLLSRDARRPRRISIGLTVLILAAPLTMEAQDPQQNQVARGAAVYGNMCGRCHNPRSPLERDDRDWVTIINHMRVRGNLTGDQVRAVLAFLQATNSNPNQRSPIAAAGLAGDARHIAATDAPISTDPRLVSAGRLLMTQKACIGCHVFQGTGGNVGPGLDDITRRKDVRFLREKLIDPTSDNATSMMPNFGLTSEEIEAILAFLATLEQGEDEPGGGG